ncbi:transcription factor Adf-1 [Stomoxys calcitrans]|uniref:transcription factor Adf-1 n=1 Tax=Stomoxys calcitrans TaxID=35570 RepID=UPI0027E28FF0|nr:transcription factor Adf-1 [Stomoxys calcitrans]
MSTPSTPIRKKRTTSKLVVLNEEELIHQVHLRPILYDRTLKSFRKPSMRLLHWQEVSDAMGATTGECRRRWRSLRDAFAKHYKQIQRTEDEHVRNKHRKWVFYDQMAFMIPYMDNASYALDDHLIEEFGDNSDDQSVHCETTVIAPSQETENNKLSSSIEEHNDNHAHQNTVSVQATDFMPVPEETVVVSKENFDFTRAQTHHTMASHHHTSCSNALHCYDSDEKFLLSCAPAMRRLTNRQNARARLEIQQILFDIEFGNRENHH